MDDKSKNYEKMDVAQLKEKKQEYIEKFWIISDRFIQKYILDMVDSNTLGKIEFIYKTIKYWQAFNTEWAISKFGPVLYDVRKEILSMNTSGLKDVYFAKELKNFKSFAFGRLTDIENLFPTFKKILKDQDDNIKFGVGKTCLELYCNYYIVCEELKSR